MQKSSRQRRSEILCWKWKRTSPGPKMPIVLFLWEEVQHFSSDSNTATGMMFSTPDFSKSGLSTGSWFYLLLFTESPWLIFLINCWKYYNSFLNWFLSLLHQNFLENNNNNKKVVVWFNNLGHQFIIWTWKILLNWRFKGFTEDLEQTLTANPISRSNIYHISHSASENDRVLLMHKDVKFFSK